MYRLYHMHVRSTWCVCGGGGGGKAWTRGETEGRGVCVCVFVRECVCVCVRVLPCVCVCMFGGSEGVSVRVLICVRWQICGSADCCFVDVTQW